MDLLFIERLVMVVLVCFTNRFPIAAAANASFPALFAFGDSILDTGNNNNLLTISKCNFPPYGRDFNGGIPTGRFCDGKVPSDLIAAALGIKETLPAYLDPNLQTQDLSTGVCFASGGSGSDNLTSTTLRVISLSTQLKNFQEYIGRLTASVGQEQASNIISKSLFLLSAGNNDIAISYSLLTRKVMPFPTYANLLVGWTSSFLKGCQILTNDEKLYGTLVFYFFDQDLYGLGARHVWVFSTLPLGCLPGARLSAAGLCNELVNGFAVQFNGMLEQELNSIKANTSDYDVQFIDVYTPLLSLIQNPSGSGFVNAVSGCCGGTAVAFGELCTVLNGQCLNPSTYVFWDFAHPTERAYRIIVSNILQKHNSSLSSSPLNFVSH